MQNHLVYLLSFLLPTAVIGSNLLGGPATLLPLGLAYGLYPMLDYSLGSSELDNAKTSSTYFNMILYAQAAAQMTCMASLFILIGREGWSSWTWVAAFGTGTNSGISAIVIAHEWIHRKSAVERGIGLFLLATVNYLHFYVEHNRGHHRWVATERDPASARYEEGVWLFVVRTIPRQWWSAWTISREIKRFPNPLMVFAVVAVALSVLLAWTLGSLALVVWWFQSLTAIALLEYVNYIRHWALRREPSEPVRVHHSWQSNNRWSRWVLVELTRHADHHVMASKEYWKLKTYSEGPFLPSGYFGCFYPCLIPSVWRRFMRSNLAQVSQKRI